MSTKILIICAVFLLATTFTDSAEIVKGQLASWSEQLLRKVIYDARVQLMFATSGCIKPPLQDVATSEVLVSLVYLNEIKKIPDLSKKWQETRSNTARDIAIAITMGAIPGMKDLKTVYAPLIPPTSDKPVSASIQQLVDDEYADMKPDEIEKRKIRIRKLISIGGSAEK